MRVLDADKNESISREEFKGGFEGWFKRWNNDPAGDLTEEQLNTGINTVLAPNSPRCSNDGWDGVWGVYSSQSRHTGGVQVLLGDGSVRVAPIDVGEVGPEPHVDSGEFGPAVSGVVVETDGEAVLG